MASFQDFVKEVERMPGVKGCMLVASDGRSLAGNLSCPEQVGPMMVLAQMAAAKVRTALGMERLRHLVLGSSEEASLAVFPLGRYLLAVEQNPHPASDLPQAIHDLVGRYQRQKD